MREAIRQAHEGGASEILLRTNMKNEAAKRLFIQVGLKPASDLVFHNFLETMRNE